MTEQQTKSDKDQQKKGQTEKDKEKPCCKRDSNVKPVKATELPIYGNPYPPKDSHEEEKPSSLELKIRCARHMVKPYLDPVLDGISRTSDVFSVGIAHTKSTFDRIGQSQDTTVKSLLIAGGGLFGLLLARRRGIVRKTFYGVLGFGAASVACYPERALEYGNIALFIAKEKLPTIIDSTYNRLAPPDNKKETVKKSEGKSNT